MMNRDILKDQIEQIGRAIGKASNIFFDLKKDGNVLLGIEEAKQELQSAIDLDIEALVKMSDEELSQYFSESLYTEDQLESLAKFIYEIAEHMGSSLPYFQTALSLIQIAGIKSQTYSMERAEWEEKIKKEMDRMG